MTEQEWEEGFKRKMEKYPGVAGAVDNGSNGCVWVMAAVSDPRQVPRPFFNIAASSPEIPTPTVVSVGLDQIPELIRVLERVRLAGAKTPAEIREERGAS